LTTVNSLLHRLAPSPETAPPSDRASRARFVVQLLGLAAVSWALGLLALAWGHTPAAEVSFVAGAWPLSLLVALRLGLPRVWAALLSIAPASVVVAARFAVGDALDLLAVAWLLAPIIGLVTSTDLPHTLSTLADALLPTRGEAGSLERLRSQVMVVTLVLSAFAALTTAPAYWLMDLKVSALLVFSFGLSTLGLAAAYRSGWSARATWLTLLGTTALMLTLNVCVEQPLEYSSLLWVLVFPVSGFLLVGQREGALGALCAVLVLLLVPLLHARLELHLQPVVSQLVLEVRVVALAIGISLFTAASERLRVNAFAESERARRARGLFIANISHELRTPMNGVLGLTELLLGNDPTPEQREHLELIARSGQSLLTVINDVLSLTSLESGALKLEPTVLRPFDIVHDVVGLLSTTATRKQLGLRVEGEGPAQVRLDATRLRQIVSNLVGNALKFTEVGEVVVRLEPALDGRFAVQVEDTGPGIPVGAREALFTPFHQVDASSTRRHGGTGLGLSISRQLARSMGGELSFTEREGGGSVFRLLLPTSVGG
jgi:signal transduction histidine kinase